MAWHTLPDEPGLGRVPPRVENLMPTEVVDERLCPTRSRSLTTARQQPARRAQQQPTQGTTGRAYWDAPTHLTPMDGGWRAVKSVARSVLRDIGQVLRCRTEPDTHLV